MNQNNDSWPTFLAKAVARVFVWGAIFFILQQASLYYVANPGGTEVGTTTTHTTVVGR